MGGIVKGGPDHVPADKSQNLPKGQFITKDLPDHVPGFTDPLDSAGLSPVGAQEASPDSSESTEGQGMDSDTSEDSEDATGKSELPDEVSGEAEDREGETPDL